MLDGVMVLNLKRKLRRKWLCTGALLAKNVPVENILYHYGPDAANYDSVVGVLEDAVADGFSNFQIPLDRKWYPDMNVVMTAQFWSYMKIARQAAEEGKTFFWIHDDWKLNYDYYFYKTLVGVLEDLGDFAFCLLDPFLSSSVDGFIMLEMGKKISWEFDIPIVNGIAGGSDVGIIVSPRGGEWLVENAVPAFFSGDRFSFTSFEGFTVYYRLYDLMPIPGVYSMEKSVVRMLADFGYMGSTIHDVELIEKEGIWKTLRENG